MCSTGEQKISSDSACHLTRLFKECDQTTERLCLGNAGTVVVSSQRSPVRETANEDAALVLRIDDEQCVLAVADGLGGQQGGIHASRTALEALRDSVKLSLSQGISLREGILSGFDRANRAVLARGDGSASTLIVATVEHTRVRIYNVGDSGALLFGGMGKLKLQSIAHSPVGYAFEAGMLDEADAMAHEDRHLISNVIGDSSMHVVVGSTRRMRPRDTLVLASDGLYDNLYADEIIDGLRGGVLADRVATLVDECAERMTEPEESRPHKPDDLTLVAYRCAAASRHA